MCRPNRDLSVRGRVGQPGALLQPRAEVEVLIKESMASTYDRNGRSLARDRWPLSSSQNGRFALSRVQVLGKSDARRRSDPQNGQSFLRGEVSVILDRTGGTNGPTRKAALDEGLEG